MSYLRHALNLFLLLTVLALVVPSSSSQDNTKSDDPTSQSDRSDDQQCDPGSLSDFIFEHPAIHHHQWLREVCFEIISPAPARESAPHISAEPSFLPQLFISGGGLMPRAPALA